MFFVFWGWVGCGGVGVLCRDIQIHICMYVLVLGRSSECGGGLGCGVNHGINQICGVEWHKDVG